MTTEDIVDEIVEVLEENGAYYNFGRDKWERHAPDPQVLDALGYLITTVILPILTNVMSDELKEKLKAWRRARREPKSADTPDIMEQIAKGPAPTGDARATAVDAVTSLLREHGWPAGEASLDAETIVARMSHSLWGEEESGEVR